MATKITKLANGYTRLQIERFVYVLSNNINIMPLRSDENLIKIGALLSDNTFGDGIILDWRNITSFLCLSREDAIEKLGLLLGNNSGIQQFTITGGSGASVTITDFTLSGNLVVFVDGILYDEILYDISGQDIIFAPAIDDEKVVTVIKF